MPTIEIKRELQFDAGHRLINHESKCKDLHGHRYRAEIYLQGGLDSVGRVMDFGDIKNKVGFWINHHWDHNMILHTDDALVRIFRESSLKDLPCPIFGFKSPYIMNCNPTAENIAAELYKAIQLNYMIPTHLTLTKVVIHETPNCSATYRP